MAEKYYSILTNRGKALEAQSSATGNPVIIKDFVVGDGNGQPVKPDPAQTKLAREVYRNAISALQVSPDQANQFIAQLVLPVGIGGFVVREVGLLTDSGELYSVANCAAIEKPENGISVNLQYRLAVSETANIELKVATGDGLFLRIDKNLSEIAAKGQAAQKSAREAIGVVDASTTAKGLVQLSSETNSISESMAATPNAVKAAYDLADKANKAAKVANDNAEKRLLKDNNLTDVSDKAKARTALELQTAAIKDVTTSNYDTTAERVLKVGDYGLGTYAGLKLLNSIFDIACTGKYTALGAGAGSSATEGMPANSGNTRFSVEADNVYTGQYWVVLRSTSQTYTGLLNTSTKTITWSQLYTTSFKPTAGDTGALPITGGTLTGPLIVQQNGSGLTIKPDTQGNGVYYLIRDADNTDIAYFGRGSNSNNNVVLNNYKGGNNSIVLNADGSISITCTNGKNLSVTGQVVTSNYGNFDARYYTKAQSDAGYMPKTGAYTKTESDGRFQPKGSYASPNSASIGTNSWFKDTGTGYMHQSGLTGTVSSGGTVTFPVPFTTKCTSVNANTFNASGSGSVMIQSISNTGFTFAVSGGYSGQLIWNAMGK